MTRLEETILRMVALILVPVVAGLSLYVKVLWADNEELRPEFNGYVAPRKLESVVNFAKNISVTIECQGELGSGFSFELDENYDFATWNFEVPDGERSILLTNYHVVEKCDKEEILVEVVISEDESISGEIVGVDPENDLAAILISKRLDWGVATPYKMRSGYWVLAAGSPFAMEGTVTFGNIIRIEDQRIYTSASLNKGNSGGPLLDNEGYVVGINTGYRAVAQNLNWAIEISRVCKKLATCEYGELSPDI